jgi:hypothetical protein
MDIQQEKTISEYEKNVMEKLSQLGFLADADLDLIWDDWIDGIPSSLSVTRQIRHINKHRKNGTSHD